MPGREAPNGQITGSYALGGLTLGSNGKVSGSLGGDTPFGSLGLNIQDGKIGSALSTDYGNLGLDYANGQLGGSFNNGALGLGMHDGKWSGETNIGPINLDYGNGQWGGGMALGGSNVSYGNGGWSGTLEGNAVEQALGGAGVDTSGFEITDATYNANTGWTGAFSNEFGTVNQDGKYSATVIPDDGDQSTTWPAVQEAATGVKTTISDLWTSIFGGEKPPEQPQVVVTEQPGQPTDGTTPNNGEPAATETEEPPADAYNERFIYDVHDFKEGRARVEGLFYQIVGLNALPGPSGIQINFGSDGKHGFIRRAPGQPGKVQICYTECPRRPDIELSGPADVRELVLGTDTAEKKTKGGNINLFDRADAKTWLKDNVFNYYENLDRAGGGSPSAANVYGSGSFTYARIDQDYGGAGGDKDPLPGKPSTDDNLQYRHLECYASSVVQMYKSLGLVPPSMSRLEFERRYTHLFNDKMLAANNNVSMGAKSSAPTDPNYQIPAKFNNALRGLKDLLGQPQLYPGDFADIATGLARTDWAKLTGMGAARFSVKNHSMESLKKLYADGSSRTARTALVDNTGMPYHYATIVGVGTNGDFLIDDPYRAKRYESDGKNLANIWTLGF